MLFHLEEIKSWDKKWRQKSIKVIVMKIVRRGSQMNQIRILPEVGYVTATLLAMYKFEKCNSIFLGPCTSNPEKHNW